MGFRKTVNLTPDKKSCPQKRTALGEILKNIEYYAFSFSKSFIA